MNPYPSQGRGDKQIQKSKPYMPIDSAKTSEVYENRSNYGDFSTVVNRGEWCADKCLDHDLPHCYRVCKESSRLAQLSSKVIARNSLRIPEIIQMYIRTSKVAISELKKYQNGFLEEMVIALENSLVTSNQILHKKAEQEKYRLQAHGTELKTPLLWEEE